MSRAVVFDAIAGLDSVGLDANTVFPNWSLDERPTDIGPFVILRWEEEEQAFDEVRGNRTLTIWVHSPLAIGNDFGEIDKILDAIDTALLGLGDVPGTDGYTLTCVRATGRGGDLKDDGFHTITRNSAYQVLSRKS